MSNLTKELVGIGLSNNESRVYLAILELGETTVARIAKKSGVKRPTVYLAIETLKARGLVNVFKKGRRTVFNAESPKKLEERAMETASHIKNVMPELLAMANAIDQKPSVRYFEGKDGIRDLFKDMLEYPKSELLEWYSESYISDFDEKFFSEYFTPERVKRNIRTRAILPAHPAIRKFVERNVPELRKTKLLSPDEYKIRTEINIYAGRKISMVAFREEVGLIIESKLIYDSMKNLFELMWKYIPGEEF